MIILIDRFCYSSMGVFGRLSIEGGPSLFSCYTIERPWLDNAPFKSCIPDGYYRAQRIEGLKKPGAEWQLTHVTDRTHIEFHVANTINDLAGCIGLGDSLGYVSDLWAVKNSTRTTKRFNDYLAGENSVLLKINRASP